MDQDTLMLVRRIGAGLADHHNTDLCPACTLQLRTMFLLDVEKNARILRRRHHAFLSNALAFVMHLRSDRVRLTAQLSASLRSCSRLDDQEHATISEAYFFDPTSNMHSQMIVSALCLIVVACLNFTPRALWRRNFKRRDWPTQLHVLTANGEFDYRGLVFWFAEKGDVNIFGTFTTVFLLCRSEFYRQIMVDPLRSTLVGAICRYLVQYTTDLRGPQSSDCLPSESHQRLLHVEKVYRDVP